MKITLSRDQLDSAITWAARALPARPTSPLLAGILLRADGDTAGLAVSAFDYEISAAATATVDALGEPGTVLVSGRLLHEITRALPAKPVTLEADQTRLTVRCGAATFTLMLLSAGEYPQLPDLPPIAGRAGSEAFAAAVTQVAVAAGKDDSLPALTCIRAEISGDRLTLAATDRYRLAMSELKWTPADPGMQTAATIPARVLLDAAKAATTAAEVTFCLDRPDPSAQPGASASPGLAGIDAGAKHTTVRLCGTEYPRYQSLIPASTAFTAEASTAELADALKRVSLVAARNTPVRCTFTDGQLTLETGTSDEAMATETLDATLKGGTELHATYNPGYLLDAITATGTGTVRFSWADPAKPVLLTPATSTGEQPAYRHVLMPIRSAG